MSPKKVWGGAALLCRKAQHWGIVAAAANSSENNKVLLWKQAETRKKFLLLLDILDFLLLILAIFNIIAIDGRERTSSTGQ